MEIPSTLWIILVVGVIGLFIFLSFRAQESKQSELEQQLTALGFNPVAEDSQLQDLLKNLYRGHGKTSLGPLYRKSGPEYNLFIFSLRANSGESHALIADRAVALLSAKLNLPEFWIIPGIPRSGWLGATAFQVISSFISGPGLSPLSFEDDPAFNNNCTLFTADEQAMTGLLTPRRREFLASFESPVIIGGGSLLVLDGLTAARRAHTPTPDTLIQRIEDAKCVFELFSSEN